MPLVEIDDGEVARLRGIERDYADAASWRKVASGIAADPKTKMEFWKLFKERHPDVPVPEYDTAQAASKPILDKVEALEKQLAEEREARTKSETERSERERESGAKRTIDRARRKLKTEGWDEEGIEKIEALMQERGIGDYDVAAAYVRSQIPAPSPLNAAYEGRDLNWFNPGDDEPDSKLLMENPQKFKSQMTRKFFEDRANGRPWAA